MDVFCVVIYIRVNQNYSLASKFQISAANWTWNFTLTLTYLIAVWVTKSAIFYDRHLRGTHINGLAKCQIQYYCKTNLLNSFSSQVCIRLPSSLFYDEPHNNTLDSSGETLNLRKQYQFKKKVATVVKSSFSYFANSNKSNLFCSIDRTHLLVIWLHGWWQNTWQIISLFAYGNPITSHHRKVEQTIHSRIYAN